MFNMSAKTKWGSSEREREKGEITISHDNWKEFWEVKRGELKKFKSWYSQECYPYDCIKITGKYPYYDME